MFAVVTTFFFSIIMSWLPVCSTLGFNHSDSMPHGMYQIVNGPISRGDIVILQTPEYFKGFGPQKETLLKIVRGLEGDTVTVSAKGVAVNELIVQNSQLLDQTSKGKPTSSLLFSGPIPHGKALVMGLHPRSFDSRYFGLVDVSTLSRVYPVFIYQTKEALICLK